MLAILAWIGFLCGQLVQSAHIHGGLPDSTAHQAPHIHLSWLMGDWHAHEREHGHQHDFGRRGTRQHNSSSQSTFAVDDESTDSMLADERSAALAELDHFLCHDDDAIYFPINSLCRPTAKVKGIDDVLSRAISMDVACRGGFPSIAPGQPLIFDIVSTNKLCAPHCARFLELRSLRI
ncbi:MAG: hypothetical protein SFX18_12810 [Pirellulales bacterium]|nr:hypothetical protein [Pirellulales bacterium]